MLGANLFRLIGVGVLRKGSVTEAILTESGSKSVLEEYQLVPGSIHDGDILRVTNGSEELKLRLCGIDAPSHLKISPLTIEKRDSGILHDLAATPGKRNPNG